MISYDYRDLFYDPDAHKDILIVPQKTQVIPKAGRTPLIKVYNPNTQTYVEQGTQVGDHKLTLNFIITNRNIYKEKFELTESINSADDLAFGSCEPQQVRFTIRNEKYKDENGEICDVVPPLTGAELIEGSVEMSSYQEIIKVYLYFNGDSSTLFYVGMYIVEEDKASKDGKTRDITAYDYLYQLRDMDISNWYKHLFGKGITTKTTDAIESGYYYNGEFYEDSEHTPELIIDPDDDTVYLDLSTDKEYYCDVIDSEHHTYYEISEDTTLEGEIVIRPGRPDKSEGGKEYWTIYELLYDLFQNLIVLKNDDSYYTGYGAQLWFDESIFNDNSKWYNLNKFKIKQNKNFIDNGSLSLGKFLEDIGIILGAYPKIMRGVPNSNGWCDALGESKDIVTPIPNASSSAIVNYTTHLTDYCVLTFIRLDKSTNKINKAQIIKEYKMLSGMSAEIYDVASVNLMRLYNSDGKVITSYSGGIVNKDLIKAYNTGKYKKIRAAYESGTNPDGTKKEGFVSITSYDVVDNIFFNQYGVKFKKKNSDGSTDTEEISIKDNEPKLQSVLKRMFNAVNSRIYKPYEMQCIADLCRETGDRIRIINKFDEFNPLDFKTYILERKLSGIQKMIDTYSAKGSNGLPNFGNYKSGSSYAQSGMGGNKVSMSGGSGGFSAESSDSEGNVEDNTIDMTTYCELARNWGMRFLDEPNVTTCTYNKKKKKVVMKWEDPDDLDDNKPIPCTWVGTVVVRKENSAPLNPYDGDIIVNSTTRDEYKTTAFQDRTAKKGKEYYYAFMPYYLRLNDIDNPIYVYRFTKTIKISTNELAKSPSIENTSASGTSITVSYTLPEDCSSAKIVAKKGEEPQDEEDGVVEDISVSATTGTITVANLDADSEYYFKIFVPESESNTEECTTGRDGWQNVRSSYTFDYNYFGRIAFDGTPAGLRDTDQYTSQSPIESPDVILTDYEINMSGMPDSRNETELNWGYLGVRTAIYSSGMYKYASILFTGNGSPQANLDISLKDVQHAYYIMGINETQQLGQIGLYLVRSNGSKIEWFSGSTFGVKEPSYEKYLWITRNTNEPLVWVNTQVPSFTVGTNTNIDYWTKSLTTSFNGETLPTGLTPFYISPSWYSEYDYWIFGNTSLGLKYVVDYYDYDEIYFNIMAYYNGQSRSILLSDISDRNNHEVNKVRNSDLSISLFFGYNELTHKGSVLELQQHSESPIYKGGNVLYSNPTNYEYYEFMYNFFKAAQNYTGYVDAGIPYTGTTSTEKYYLYDGGSSPVEYDVPSGMNPYWFPPSSFPRYQWTWILGSSTARGIKVYADYDYINLECYYNNEEILSCYNMQVGKTSLFFGYNDALQKACFVWLLRDTSTDPVCYVWDNEMYSQYGEQFDTNKLYKLIKGIEPGVWENCTNKRYNIGTRFNGYPSGLGDPVQFSRTSEPSSYEVIKNDTFVNIMPSSEEVYSLNYGGMKFTPFSNNRYFIQFTFDNNDDYGVLIYSDYIEDGPYLLLGINEGDQLGQICVYVKYTSESGLGEALTYIQPNQTASESSKQRMYHWISQNAVD